MESQNSNQINYQKDTTPSLNFLTKDIALKALLFSMVFYIVNSNLMLKLLQCFDKYPIIEKNFIQAIIFGLLYYVISVNL
jgi:hypothetical protein